MYKLVDKHGKKFLAVAGTLLILVFLLPPNIGGGNHSRFDGGGTGGIGSVNGQPVDVNQVINAQRSLQTLEALHLFFPGERPDQPPTEGPAPRIMFGPGLAQELQRDPLHYYLLLREARQAGVSVPDAELDDALRDPATFRLPDGKLVPISNINPNVVGALKAALREAVSIDSYARRNISTIKVSTPVVNEELARDQDVTIKLAAFDASTFAASAPAPTDEQIRTQFDTFAATMPGMIDSTRNPFGFGYRLPDQLRLQYVLVPVGEVEAAIVRTKTPELWEEEALIFYQRNPQDFQTPAPDMIQDADATTGAATDATKKSPTTRPYDDARVDVLTALRRPLVQQKTQAIINRLTQQLNADYQKATAGKNPTTQTASAVTALGPQLGSFEYLQALAAQLQSQFDGVKLRVVSDADLRSRRSIVDAPGIGSAVLDSTDRQNPQPISAGDYLFATLRPLIGVAAENRAGVIDLLQPTRVLRGADGFYIARVVEVVPSSPPRIVDDVLPQIKTDLARKASFDLARNAAQNALDIANKSGLANVPNVTIQTSKPFSGGRFGDLGIAGAEMWSYKLIEPSFDLLRGIKSASELPRRTIVPLHEAGKVVVVELETVTTRLTPDMAEFTRLRAQRTVAQELLSREALIDWLTLPAVSKRLGFVSSASVNSETAPPEQKPIPINPFLPG